MKRSDIHIDGDRWVQFSLGVTTRCNGFPDTLRPPADPPADWQDPKCKTCVAELVPTPRAVVNGPIVPEYGPCPDCIDGLRRIAVTEPCEHHECGYPRRAEGMEWTCDHWRDDGLVTVVHVVQDWGPIGPLAFDESGTVLTVRANVKIGSLNHLIPPDVDPQTLVGQWARGGRVVS